MKKAKLSGIDIDTWACYTKLRRPVQSVIESEDYQLVAIYNHRLE